MLPEKENKIAYTLLTILFIVGVISYWASPSKTSEAPVRIVFKNLGGKVLFDHKTHMSPSGYGLSCKDCHHHYEDEESASFRSCVECHKKDEIKMVPQECKDCHDPDKTHHPTEDNGELRVCSECHVPKNSNEPPKACGDCHSAGEVEGKERGMDFKNKTDAFHSQCEGCHKEINVGPADKNARCKWCHSM
ncbi:MAG: hypothetical protein HQK79_14350 [Desulfobacterales bacterium]|nr:hypothetical protein [Desulfobacterales bacterium]MBF0396320.1 hypothetical protein [Desulfobacterales bacterium]